MAEEELPPSPSLLLAREAEETRVLYVVYYHYDSSAIDISEDHHPHNHLLPDPILILPANGYDCPRRSGFGRLGSSIYIVGGRWTRHRKRQPKHSVKVYIIDLERLLPTAPHTVGRRPSFLREGPPLKSPKSSNPIILTIQGKLFAITRCFDPEDDMNNPGACAEYLDPNSNEWVVIPDPVDAYGDIKNYARGRKRPFDVVSYVVLGSIVVLQLGCELAYELDCNNPDQGWKVSSKFDSLSGLKGSDGSDNVNGLLFPRFEAGRDQPESLVAYELTQEEGSYEAISFRHPKQREKGSRRITTGESRVVDCGGGEALIFTSGFGGMAKDYFMKLYFNMEVVSLEKSAGGRKRSRHGAGPKTPHINCVPLRSFSYFFGEVEHSGYVRACLTIGMPANNTHVRDSDPPSSITLSLKNLTVLPPDKVLMDTDVRMASRSQQAKGRKLAALRELARVQGLPYEYLGLEEKKLMWHLGLSLLMDCIRNM